MNNPHSSNNNIISCSSSGKIINPNNFFIIPADNKYAILKHYSTKTIEEYCSKLKRGKPDMDVILDKETLLNGFKFFFLINKKTKEKIEYINYKFNLTFK